LNRSRLGVKLLVAVAVLLAIAAGILIRYSDEAVQIPPTSAWTADVQAEDECARSAVPQFRLAAPNAHDDRNAGVADAARQYAIQFVTPDLKHPASAAFPPEVVRFERLEMLNRTTLGRIEHWSVHGAVDSRNGYGATVRSRWRIVLGRADNHFFPVIVILEEFGIYRFQGHVDMLAEARQAARQELVDREAAQKAKDLAARRALWQAVESAKPAEEKAQAALKMAVILLKQGRNEPARRRLQEVIDQFPGTDAAAEAAKLLKQ
jgi:hypothetical protein